MTRGSLQLRLYRLARADNADIADAADFAGITLGEAALHDAADARDPPRADECVVPKAWLPRIRVVGDPELLTALCGERGRL